MIKDGNFVLQILRSKFYSHPWLFPYIPHPVHSAHLVTFPFIRYPKFRCPPPPQYGYFPVLSQYLCQYVIPKYCQYLCNNILSGIPSFYFSNIHSLIFTLKDPGTPLLYKPSNVSKFHTVGNPELVKLYENKNFYCFFRTQYKQCFANRIHPMYACLNGRWKGRGRKESK